VLSDRNNEEDVILKALLAFIDDLLLCLLTRACD